MLSFMSEMLSKFFSMILKVFPTDPFMSTIYILQQIPSLGWLNWIVPVGDMLKIMTLWLGAIVVYYIWSVIARWIKLIQ